MKKLFLAFVIVGALALPAVAEAPVVLTMTKMYDLYEAQQTRIEKLEAKLQQLDDQHSAELDSLSKAIRALQSKR